MGLGLMSFVPGFVHPAADGRRGAFYKGVVRDVPGDQGTGGDKGVGTDRHAAEDNRPGAQRTSLGQPCLLKGIGVSFGSGVAVVGKGHTRPDEHIVFHHQAIPQVGARLYRYIVPDDDIAFHERVAVQVAILPYARAGEHDGELPDARTFSDRGGLYVGEGMNVYVLWCHAVWFRAFQVLNSSYSRM